MKLNGLFWHQTSLKHLSLYSEKEPGQTFMHIMADQTYLVGSGGSREKDIAPYRRERESEDAALENQPRPALPSPPHYSIFMIYVGTRAY